jgi:hypothetical protein
VERVKWEKNTERKLKGGRRGEKAKRKKEEEKEESGREREARW